MIYIDKIMMSMDKFVFSMDKIMTSMDTIMNSMDSIDELMISMDTMMTSIDSLDKLMSSMDSWSNVKRSSKYLSVSAAWEAKSPNTTRIVQTIYKMVICTDKPGQTRIQVKSNAATHYRLF